MKVIRLLLVSFFVLCVSTTNVVASKESKGNSVINQTYPQAQAEVAETFMAIAGSIIAGAGMGADSVYMDQLISFHAYGPKFVEFNGGIYDSEENENNERQTFGVGVRTVEGFNYVEGTLNIAVYYGNVANLTFLSDFDLILEDGSEAGNPVTLNNLITLLFVKTKGEWKIVHEHHSPYNPVH